MSLGNSSIHQIGEIPEITKLPNGRIRVVRRFVKFTREDVDNVQLGTLLGDFGDLDTTDEQIPNQGYTNCRLIEVEVETSTKRSSGTDSSSSVLVQTYETLTDVFVETTDPTISYSENGLKQVTKVSRAISGTTSSNVVGTTFIPVDPNEDPLVPDVWLASYQIEDNTAFAELTEVYIEAGILSETIDKVGSQQSTIIESIKIEPTAPTGYVLANQQKSEFEGLQTNRFTFLKPDVELSNSEDNVGSENRITEQWFKPSIVVGTNPATVDRRIKTGYSLAKEEESDVGGIPTARYTFLKEDVKLSESEDEVGSQNAITEQWFKPLESSDDPLVVGRDQKTNYSLARREKSDVEGIPTERYTFLKNNVVLSVSEDKVGSQKAVVNEVFNPTIEVITGIDTDGTALSGYSEANRTESDYEGIKTIRVQFLKPSILSLQQDFNNGLKLVSVQAFGMTASTVSTDLSAIIGSHELISQNESDYEGIKTSTFQYQIDESLTEDYDLNGLKRISLLELSSGNFTPQTIGGIAGVEAEDPDDNPTNIVPSGSPLIGLYLGSQNIDNGGNIKTRESVWAEAGILSISPTENNFSLARSYTYRTSGIKASSMSDLTTPSGDPLTDDVTWFEPSIQFPSGFPTFTQVVLLKSIDSEEEETQVKIDTRSEFFTVTDAGVMECNGIFSPSENSGAVAIWPRPSLEPVTYRKKATVEIFLTKSGTFDEEEVAYSEESVQWCSIGFENYYSSETTSAASASGSFRSFPNYLNSAGASTFVGSPLGNKIKYNAYAESYATGSTVGDGNWVTEGIYRVNLEEYTKDVDGNQLYLKTIVTFPAEIQGGNGNENP